MSVRGVTLNWLIVEDEADIRNLVVMMCQVWGNTPMPYESGQKAWDWLDTVEDGTYTGTLPEFALMDIRMPGKRGNEIAERIRTVEKLKHIPIVLMTAFVMSDDEMERMRKDFGVDEVINKPLPDFDQLRAILYGIIERKKNSTKDTLETPAIDADTHMSKKAIGDIKPETASDKQDLEPKS
jgi:two-component system sensor histidine kinase/response regulator